MTEKFKLLCITYGFPREVRYDKGPQFSFEFEEFLKEIYVNPTPSSAKNPRSNCLAEAGVRNAKILLRKSLEEKSSYAEVLQYFNQAPGQMDTHPASCSMDTASDLISLQSMRLWMWIRGRPTGS